MPLAATMSTYSTLVGLKILAKRFGAFNNLIRLPSSLICGAPLCVVRASEIIAQSPAIQAGRFECTNFQNTSDYIEEVKTTLSDLRFEITFVTPYQYNMFLNKISVLDKILADLKLQTFDSSMRPQPYGVLIKGVPGCGKSSFAYKLAQKMCAITGKPLHRSEMVVLNESDEFQSEFRSHHRVVIFDDIAAEQKDVASINPWRKIIDFINNIPKTSLNPHLELKGNILIRPEIVIVTSNIRDLDLATRQFMISPEAIARRFPDIVSIESGNNVHHDVYTLTTDVQAKSCLSYSNNYGHLSCKDYTKSDGSISNTNVSRDTIIDNIASKYRSHYDEQRKFINSVNDGFAKSSELNSKDKTPNDKRISSWTYKPSLWFTNLDKRKIQNQHQQRSKNLIESLYIPLKLCRSESNNVNYKFEEDQRFKDTISSLESKIREMKMMNKSFVNTISQLKLNKVEPVTLDQVLTESRRLLSRKFDGLALRRHLEDVEICVDIINDSHHSELEVTKIAFLVNCLQDLIHHLQTAFLSASNRNSILASEFIQNADEISSFGSLSLSDNNQINGSITDAISINNCDNCDICPTTVAQIHNDELIERIGKHGFFKHLLSENPVLSYLNFHLSTRLRMSGDNYMYTLKGTTTKGVIFKVHDDMIFIQYNFSKTKFRNFWMVRDVLRLASFANFSVCIDHKEDIILQSSAARTGTQK